MEQTLKISKIREGTVIDHIPAGKAIRVLAILKIDEKGSQTVSVGIRVPSGRIGSKDVVKIEGRYLERFEVDKISLIAPDASISIVKNYEVVEKFRVDLPERVTGIIKCSNRNCITNSKEPVLSEFFVSSKKPLVLRCYYCERNMQEKDIINYL
ncbi:MAG: aspartate carbamoyltransferase regulatory subunit [Candidatus Thermoplasmatota archaeon]|nr:aspartate carbamoyltransferase regulatory subunit [Candidatus Thermoplasmatota archaeon]